ncbi:hypothetical protein [Pseudomonas sp. St316]|uniref:hypothetical protein n=1 Tax=Pseudomonas sp. St316 TaxID=2678257 RepID=UPI001BB40991|nr:hypothetical protein [Pseudomonas sp. St316]BBP57801.1 hypothetical protein PHLH4_13910 [Pseudomonas sp. St316]
MAKAAPNRVKAETLSLRISPNLKFGLELLSRLEERSLTTEVEKALGELFDRTPVDIGYLGTTTVENNGRFEDLCFFELMTLIYSIDAPTRLMRTAVLLPRTLTQREIALLDLASDQAQLFAEGAPNYFSLNIGHENLLAEVMKEYCRFNQPLDLKSLRRNWQTLNDAVDYALDNGHYPEKIMLV